MNNGEIILLFFSRKFIQMFVLSLASFENGFHEFVYQNSLSKIGCFFVTCSYRFLHPNYLFQLAFDCSKVVLDLIGNSSNKLKSVPFQKLFRPFNSLKRFFQSLYFFIRIGQNNFWNKIPFLDFPTLSLASILNCFIDI